MAIKQKSFLKVAAVAVVAVVFGSVFLLQQQVAADTYKLPDNGNCNTGDTKVTTNGVTECQTPTTPAAAQSGQTAQDDNETTCAIDKIGWMLCPLIEKAGVVGDQAFQLLSKNFLETEPELVASLNGQGGKSGTYIAWELARNIANIMFIAAFLIIILSQVTGRGLDNYGVKKLLPKLIIAAIAVNISYYICQLMVDLTNVLGYEIENFMVQTAAQVTHSVVLPVNTGFTSTQTSNGALGAMASGILGIAAIVWFLLPVLFLGVSTVVITCLVIIAILLMRKAFIVLLVVLSPIAFVLYLLPNTEKYFQKWMNMFWQLLLVFPVVSLLFGAGQLASAIILVAGSNGGGGDVATTQTVGSNVKSDAYKDGSDKCIQLATINSSGVVTNPNAEVKTCGDKSTPLMLGLVAAGIAVAPMLAVWAVLKGALSAAGAIGGKIAGQIQGAGDGANKILRRPEDAARKWAFNSSKDWAKDKIVTDALNGGRGAGVARFVRRRQKGKELREAERAAALARFDNKDGLGADLTHDIMAQKELANAAGIAGQRDFMANVDKGYNIAAQSGGALSESMKKAIDTLEKRATDEVIKGIKEGFDSTNVDVMKSEFKAAVAGGDVTRAKAMQEMLLASGSKGIEKFHEAYDEAGVAANASLNKSLYQHIQTASPGAKDKDGSIKAWADNGGDLTSHFNSEWSNVDTAEKFSHLSGFAQAQAFKQIQAADARNGTNRIDEFTKAFKASPDSQKSLDATMRANFGL